MKKAVIKTVAVAGLCVSMLAAAIPASAAYNRPEGGGPSSGVSQSMGQGGGQAGGFGAQQPGGQPQGGGFGAQQPGGQPQGGGFGAQQPGGQPQGGAFGAQQPEGQPQDGAFGAQQPGDQPQGGAFGAQQQNGPTGGMAGGQMNALPDGTMQNPQPGGQMGQQPGGQMGGDFAAQQNGGAPGMNNETEPFGRNTPFEQGAPFGQDQMNEALTSTGEAGEIVAGATTNSAAALEADYENAATITMSDENNDVTIKEAGTYIITGTCADGNIKVKKGASGVVLILQDLDLTSTTGATLSVNKTAEAKIIISGSVKLTDAENPADEDVSDDFDGAAIKVKAGASAYITGSGSLSVNGSAKNGIKVTGDADEGYGSLVIDGAAISITAVNDAINANHDLAILSGTVTISAGDDAIHADRILTIGADGNGPTVTVNKSYEGIEATVVNLCGGTVNIASSDDGVNAANSDGAFQSELAYSINMTGGSLTVNTGADGLDSNGNINLIDGSATIHSVYNGGDAGMDYDGSLYISDAFSLNNAGGVAGPDNMMGGMPGGMGGSMNGVPGGMGGEMGSVPGGMGGMNGTPGEMGAPGQNTGSGFSGGMGFGGFGGMGFGGFGGMGFGGMNGGFRPNR